MTLQLVEVLEKAPASCYLCGGVPCDLEGNAKPMVDTEAEANWGDNVYICQECAAVIASLFGWQTDEEHIKALKELHKENEAHVVERQKLIKRIKHEKKLNKRIDKGKRALRAKSEEEKEPVRA